MDPTDHEALVRVFGRARAVISTAGPYQLYGTPIVKAAVVSCQFFFFFFLENRKRARASEREREREEKKGLLNLAKKRG